MIKHLKSITKNFRKSIPSYGEFIALEGSASFLTKGTSGTDIDGPWQPGPYTLEV